MYASVRLLPTLVAAVAEVRALRSEVRSWPSTVRKAPEIGAALDSIEEEAHRLMREVADLSRSH